jgi:two-component system sensor histidine kinase PhoQ
MRSLHGRLLVAATLALAGFLGAAGVALQQAFRDSAEAAMRERLLGHVYALLSAADEDRDGRMLLPLALPDPRFNNPDSGLYASVESDQEDFLWRSPSMTGRTEEFLRRQRPGERDFHRQQAADRELMVINFGISWEDYLGLDHRYTFAVAADTAPLREEIDKFGTTLWAWLGGLALLLLLVQGGVLRWGLKPLREVADDLRRIEAGETDRLGGRYPKELVGLTGNLNTLIVSAQANQRRYRNSLDDLAHSMKTPLAILRNAANEGGDPRAFGALVREQVERMDAIVQHQLRRAAASGRSALGRAVEVGPLVQRLSRSLGKVYRDKAVRVDLGLAPGSRFFGDEADLMEVLGNVLENAFKYGRGVVRVASRPIEAAASRRPGLEVRIEDDGPGIDPARAEEAMERGRRMDESVPGQGIGLSVAREIVEVYDGRITFGISPLGGLAIDIRFPPD